MKAREDRGNWLVFGVHNAIKHLAHDFHIKKHLEENCNSKGQYIYKWL